LSVQDSNDKEALRVGGALKPGLGAKVKRHGAGKLGIFLSEDAVCRILCETTRPCFIRAEPRNLVPTTSLKDL
jgi:hypothetical protein